MKITLRTGRRPGWWWTWVPPLMGFCALVWFLIRVIPKPSRATYPCQRAAFPAATGFVIWLIGVLSVKFLFGKLRAWCASPRWWWASFVTVLVLWTVIGWPPPGAEAWTPDVHGVLGTARGIRPGRVVWARDPLATRWNGVSGYWWNDYTGSGATTNGTDQSVVNNMLSWSLRALADAPSDEAAWDAIFRHFNSTRGRGDIGYAAGEKIAIKVNFNNTSNVANNDNQADASPHSIIALLRQLVNHAGVAQSNITVYEAPNTSPSRVIPNRAYDKCTNEFPNVVFAHCTNVYGRVVVQWATNALSYSVSNTCGRNVPTVVTNATYLINMALLKGHSTCGVTLTAKNHYGSINTREHTFINAKTGGMGTYSPFVDLIGSPHLGGKTLLFMIDGLYGVRNVGTTVSTNEHWRNLFGNQWSASYFLSLDPVAIDSVGADFLLAEFGDALGGNPANCDNYLHEAALAHAPPSGVNYTNHLGTLPSLGAHEHWNNPTNKLYSRNLGAGAGIELVANTDANLSLNAAASSPAVAGYRQTYTLTITNTGPVVATSATLTNFWPAHATFISATSSQGSCTTNAGGAIIASLGTLAVSGVASVTVVVAYPTSATGIATNDATATATQRDAYIPNNRVTFTTEIQADTDADGLPDVWEQTHFGDPTNAVATADTDGDGQSNLHEYLAGTDPLNAASILRVTGNVLTGGFALDWPSVPGKTYQVQYCDTLGSGWADLPAARYTAAPEQTSLTHTDATVAVHRFYRVQVLPP